MTTATTPTAPAAATPAAAPAIPPVVEDESFDAAFARLNEEPAPAAAPAPTIDPAATLTDPADVPATETAPAPAATTPAPEGTAAAPAAATPPAPAPAVGAAPDELSAARARIAELEAAAKAPPAPAAAPAAATPPAPVVEEAPQWYQPTDDEKAALEKHKTDWPEISAAEEVRTKIAVNNAVAFVFHQIKKVYNPVLDGFKASIEGVEDYIARAEVKGKHSDYDAIYDNVIKWVDTLPTAFKIGAKQVIDNGTPDEVNELIAQYKTSNPAAAAATTAAASATATPAAPVAAVKAELSAAARKAAGKLSVVDSKRTATTTAADPNDFDGAWAEANAAQK